MSLVRGDLLRGTDTGGVGETRSDVGRLEEVEVERTLAKEQSSE